VLGLSALIQLCAAIIYGTRVEWFRFGLSLAGCVIMMTFFSAILVVCKIDSRFNQLEKTIRENLQEQKEEKVIKERTDKYAEA